jgi:uncharacterized membrane protein
MKNPYFKTDRLEMFTDGVFAIAITLLVLEIKIPSHEQVHQAGGLYNYLLYLWPAFASYVMSFLAIGIYWSNLHHMYTYVIKKTNHTFNLLNVLFLMTIAFMPFSTAVFADFVLDKDNFGAAVSIFSLGFVLPVPTVLIMYMYANHNKHLIDKRLSEAFIKKQFIKLFISFLLLLTAFTLSFFYPTVSLIMILGSFTLYFLPPDAPEYLEEVE